MMDEMPRFTNPWADSDQFIPLGSYDYTIVHERESIHRRYDLYALYNPGANKVSFGARYGNQPEQYLSGAAHCGKDGRWEIYGGRELAMAAARFFANELGRQSNETCNRR